MNLNQIYSKQKQYLENNAKVDVKKIKNQLKKLKTEIINHTEEIYTAFYQDYHKPKFEVYTTEISIVLSEINWFIKHLNKIHRPKKYYDNLWIIGHKTKAIRKQYGMCLIYSPYNYPFNLSLTPLIGAIAMNNSVMLKLASYNKNLNKVIYKILHNVFDDSQCCVLNELKKFSYEELYNLKVDHVFFTGSETVGKQIYLNYAKQLIPVVLELGGKSPCIVDKDVDLIKTARRIVWAKLLNNGQTCVAVDYLICHQDIYESLLKEIINQFNLMYPVEKNGVDIAYTVNDNISKFNEYIKDQKIVYSRKLNENQFPFTIIKVDKNNLDNPLMNNEIFGPILPIITFNDYKQINQIIRFNDNPLCTYVFTKNKKLADDIFYQNNSGGFVWNDAIIHIIKHSPFGGIKNSGLGQYHKMYSVNTFSQLKPYIKSSQLDPQFRYAPYDEHKLNLMKRFNK